MSDTPKTDAACFAVVSNDPKSVVVWAGVARDLERENAALREEIAALGEIACLNLDDATVAKCDAVTGGEKYRDVMRRLFVEQPKELAALRALVDHAETLLCNSLPMAHCSQVNWGEIIRKWRDQKHAINLNDDTSKLLKACVEYRAMVDRLETENAALRSLLREAVTDYELLGGTCDGVETEDYIARVKAALGEAKP